MGKKGTFWDLGVKERNLLWRRPCPSHNYEIYSWRTREASGQQLERLRCWLQQRLEGVPITLGSSLQRPSLPQP